MAGLEAAVAATATTLAKISQEPVALAEAASGLSSWLRQSGDVVLLGGVALGSTLLMAGLILEVRRRKVSEESRKRI